MASVLRANWGEPHVRCKHRKRSRRIAFATFLRTKFGLDFVSSADIATLAHPSMVAPLAKHFENSRNDKRLAENDASMMIYVREIRKRDNEKFGASAYGFKSWWLTEEFRTIQEAKVVGFKDQVKMHPQFLTNVIMIAPDLRDVADNSRAAFPLAFGLKITQRVTSETLADFLQQVKDVSEMEEALQVSKMQTAMNLLKSRPPLI